MEPFKKFAFIYDQLLGRYVHEYWRQYFEKLVKNFRIEYQSAADAACGTGNEVKYWADQGVRKIFGTDYSDSMLTVARKINKGNCVRFFEQDLVCFNVPEEVDLITCNFGSLNYITKADNLAQAFAQFYANLNKDGFLICDINTIYHLKNQWGTKTHYLHDESAYTVWVTEWDERERQTTQFMDNFVRRENGLFAHSSEVHVHKGYELAEILRLLEYGGFQPERTYLLDLVTLDKVRPESDRYLIIAKK